MFLTSVLMFLMSSTLWSLDIVNIILPMRQIFDKTESGIEKSYSNLNQIRWFWQSFVFTLEVRATSRYTAGVRKLTRMRLVWLSSSWLEIRW